MVSKASGASRIYVNSPTLLDSATINLSGASKAYLHNVNILDVKASGASKVYYETAEKITEKLSGASKLVPNSGSSYNENIYFEEINEPKIPTTTPLLPQSTSSPSTTIETIE